MNFDKLRSGKQLGLIFRKRGVNAAYLAAGKVEIELLLVDFQMRNLLKGQPDELTAILNAQTFLFLLLFAKRLKAGEQRKHILLIRRFEQVVLLLVIHLGLGYLLLITSGIQKFISKVEDKFLKNNLLTVSQEYSEDTDDFRLVFWGYMAQKIDGKSAKEVYDEVF